MTRNKRNPFFETQPQRPAPKRTVTAVDTGGGAFGFFREYAVRETIESILVAIMLAFIFRMFLAEAFVIPTGSMAPSLKGAHKEIACDQSEFTYAVGASDEQRGPARVTSTFCPITQHETQIFKNDPDQKTFSGDRILVNKFIYDFQEPERFDVIVFKNPNNGKQNYIKRLIGLPGDNILIENGDIHLMHQQNDGRWLREIARKPPERIRTTLQVVDDTHHIGRALKEVGWPLRWQPYRGQHKWNILEVDGNPIYGTTGSGESGWLRYRHFRPHKRDWVDSIDRGNLPLPYRDPKKLPAGGLIPDHYAYNDMAINGRLREVDGFHWVGDLGVAIDVEIKSANGTLLLDLVEGGAHYFCELDVATGEAKFKCDHPEVQFLKGTEAVVNPSASTSIKGPGAYQILYLNADDRLHLWVDGRNVPIEGAEYRRNDIPIPKYSAADPGDAEPLGIATRQLEISISRLAVLRDLYYSSVRGTLNQGKAGNESEFPPDQIRRILEDPEIWNTPQAMAYFTAKKGQTEPMFQLQVGATREKDQFLPMGDNSPQSLDGRIWDGPNFFERDLLIGRAIFVYFPRFTRVAGRIPFPNFKDMRFIR